MPFQLNMFEDRTALEKLRTRVGKNRQPREASLGETQRVFKHWGTGLVKCLHSRSYFVECAKCRRTRSEAEENFACFSEKLARVHATKA